MNKSTLILTGLLAGCAVKAPSALEAPAEDISEAYNNARTQVEDDLQALEALQLFEVQEMVFAASSMPGACYGTCPDEAERMAAYVEQAARLHALVELADDNVDDLGPCYTTASTIVNQSLDALDELEILDVGTLIITEPETQSTCYNLPCPEDLQRAEEINERRALQIWHLSERSTSL